MTALTQLVRLQRWTLDEKRQKLAELERLAARLRQELESLEDSLEAERPKAGEGLEEARAMTSYAAAVAERRRTCQRSIADVETEIEAARAEIEEVFQELKRYEQGLRSQQDRDAKKRARREQATLDEVGLNAAVRRRQAR
ncbi:MAG: flagellar FliJ family protein [Kiloniellales bacterium]|nr:flagellar FliJ family protein [Kiloniellales bacterium]